MHAQATAVSTKIISFKSKPDFKIHRGLLQCFGYHPGNKLCDARFLLALLPGLHCFLCFSACLDNMQLKRGKTGKAHMRMKSGGYHAGVGEVGPLVSSACPGSVRHSFG